MSTGHDQIDQHYLDAIADADQYPYWMEDVDEPDSNATLVRTESCDLCVVGGGYTGLWTAIVAKERDPSADVVLIDAHECGSAASGRNGGFMDASLTHGVGNAMARWPDEIEILEELGRRNLNEIEAAIRKYEIDCDYERTGVIEVANKYHPPTYLDEVFQEYELLDGSATTSSSSTPRRCRRRFTRRSTRAGSGPRTTARSSTRPDWCGASKRRRSGWVCGSTRTPKPRNSSGTASASSSRRRSERSGPARWRSPPTPSSPC